MTNSLYSQEYNSWGKLVKDGTLSQIQEKISSGFDINSPAYSNKNDASNALFVCIEYNRIDVFQFLINSGIDINGSVSSGILPLEYACSLKLYEFVKILVELKAKLKNNEGESVMKYCVNIEDHEVMDKMIDAGAELDIKNSFDAGYYFFVACDIGSIELARSVVESMGANGLVVFSDIDLNSSLKAQKKDNDLTWTSFREEYTNGRHYLFHAIKQNQVEIVKLLISEGAFLDYVDPQFNETALMIAASDGKLAITKLLIESGADPEIKDKYGETALKKAKEKSQDHIVKYLKSMK